MTSLINSIAKLIQCRRCTGWIYEAHIHGWKFKVDPDPLDFETEIAARIAGRKIFQTLPVGIDFELDHRSLWHITNPSPRAKVLVEHDCTMPTIFQPSPLYEFSQPKEPNF